MSTVFVFAVNVCSLPEVISICCSEFYFAVTVVRLDFQPLWESGYPPLTKRLEIEPMTVVGHRRKQPYSFPVLSRFCNGLCVYFLTLVLPRRLNFIRNFIRLI